MQKKKFTTLFSNLFTQDTYYFIEDDYYSKEGGLLHPSNFKNFTLPLCKGNTPHTKESEEGII